MNQITESPKKHSQATPEQISAWFEGYIHDIELDALQIKLGVASEDKSKVYHALALGDVDELAKSVRRSVHQHLIQNVVTNFLMELGRRDALPVRLAFSLTPATILVWAEIPEDDEKMEDQILLSEAVTNAYAVDLGFNIDTMIVETGDKIPVPSHYTELQLKKVREENS